VSKPQDEMPQLARPRSGWWSCPHCPHRREYATDQGALAGAAAHLLHVHRVRLTLPIRHHGNLFGGGR